MSGRYRNHRGGRGGLGRGRGRYTPKTSHTKKELDNYLFYLGSSKQSSDYEITSELIVNHIKKTFNRGNDVPEAL